MSGRDWFIELDAGLAILRASDGSWCRPASDEEVELWAELSTLREREAHNADQNVCEHGDHPAPAGSRFCSASCEQCEHAGDEGCSGLCAFGAPDEVIRLKAEISIAQELIDATLRWRDYDETHDPKSPGWTTAPIVGFFQAVERYRCAKKATDANR